jgi:hypothetical protein
LLTELTLTLNALYLTPWEVYYPIRLNAFSIRSGTIGVGHIISMGIYDSVMGTSRVEPNALLDSTTELFNDGADDTTREISWGIDLLPGIYWIGMGQDGGSNINVRAAENPRNHLSQSGAASSIHNAGVGLIDAGGMSGGMPATISPQTDVTQRTSVPLYFGFEFDAA